MSDINDEVKLLIDNFFSITGRPVSTMTVNEYRDFYSLAKETVGSDQNMSHPCKSHIATKTNIETLKDIPIQSSPVPLPELQTESEDCPSQTTIPQKTTLQMLQSISG